VRRQQKWETIGTEVNGHFGACSCSLEAVKYRQKGAGRDLRNIRQVLAGGCQD